MKDFGARDTEHIAGFLAASGAPTMAAEVRQRCLETGRLRDAVKFAIWVCDTPAADLPTAKAYFERVLGIHDGTHSRPDDTPEPRHFGRDGL